VLSTFLFNDKQVRVSGATSQAAPRPCTFFELQEYRVRWSSGQMHIGIVAVIAVEGPMTNRQFVRNSVAFGVDEV
jgi:hypothetical protein